MAAPLESYAAFLESVAGVLGIQCPTLGSAKAAVAFARKLSVICHPDKHATATPRIQWQYGRLQKVLSNAKTTFEAGELQVVPAVCIYAVPTPQLRARCSKFRGPSAAGREPRLNTRLNRHSEI